MTIARIVTVCLNPAVDRTIQVPGLEIGAHQSGREILRIAGGKAVNVSRVLSAQGRSCVATGFLGRLNRYNFDQFLADPHITDAFVELDGLTRENITLVDPQAGSETHIRDAGLAVGPEALAQLTDRLDRWVVQGAVAVFSGSLPPGVSPAQQVEWIARCARAGAKVAVDTSGAALKALGRSTLWLIKPNLAELGDLVGEEIASPAQALEAARRVARRVENVLVSMGEQGAMLVTQGSACQACAPVPAGQVRNTVGCGDALLGAFLAGLAEGEDGPQALAQAVAVASAAAQSPASATYRPALARELRSAVEMMRW